MKYFNYLSKEEKKELFYKEPEAFTKNQDKDLLSYALGATLYMPGIRRTIGQDIIEKKIRGLVSVIICLEDAIGDSSVNNGIQNLISQINQISKALYEDKITKDDMPLIFIRIRSLAQIQHLAEALKEKISLLTGFAIPKFSVEDGEDYFKEIEKINKEWKTSLYIMPILEARNTIYLENRLENLIKIKALFDKYKDLILNIRLGITDFSSLFALRRNIDNTLYDLAVIKDCLGNITNIFGRCEDEYIISGSVWEYFSIDTSVREWYLEKPISGLIKECTLDKENGFIGKTVIHPSQIIPVQSLQVVSYEEYMDASHILYSENHDNGVIKSIYKNKMNEVKPHLNWAKKIIKKSQIYGVYNENKYYKDLLERR